MPTRIKQKKTIRIIPVWMSIAPWLIVGGVLLLSALLIISDITNSQQNKERTFQLFEEKGNSLIHSFEAALFAGRGFSWSRQELQTILNEQANLTDVHFLAITDSNSTVIASSEQALVGQRLISPKEATEFTPSIHPKSQRSTISVIDAEGAEKKINVFQIYRELLLPLQTRTKHGQTYRFFLPTPMQEFYESSPHGRMKGMHNEMKNMPNKNQERAFEADEYFFPFNKTLRYSSNELDNQYIMFVCFDTKEIIRVIEEENRRTFTMQLILVFIGIVSLLSLFVIRAYQRSIKMIQESKAFTLALVDTLPLGIITLDVNKKILTVNSQATAITHICEEDILGDALNLAIPQLADLELDLEKVIEKNIICQFDEHTTTPLDATTFPINSQEDRYGYAIILRDLSEIQHLEKALHRQERLAALGNMAAGIAHEIRNPLGSIKGLAKYFEESVPKESEDAKLAAVMTQEVLRMDKVVGDLLELAKSDSIFCTSFPLTQLFDDVKTIIQKDLEAQNINLKLEIATNSCEVYLDFDRTRQILLNLLLNAIQAMPNGGDISITAQKEHNFITIKIEDTGEGIAPHDLNTIFSPYYTTKAKGTGLGLSMVQKYVDAHDGQIEIQSKPTKGTSVLMYFPQITKSEAEND